MPQELHKQAGPYKPKKGETYMSSGQLMHFRNILEGIKFELGRDIDRTVHTMQDEATIFADPNDRASQESDMALELRNRDRGNQVGSALQRGRAVYALRSFLKNHSSRKKYLRYRVVGDLGGNSLHTQA